MAFKTTIESMRRNGWEFSDSESTCNKCGQPIRWGRSPEGKNMSFDPHPSTNYHIKSCPGIGVRPASTIEAPAARPAQRYPERTSVPAPAPASAPTPAAETRTPLQQSIDALTAEIRNLLAEIKARRPVRTGYDPDGCPSDRH